MRSSKFAHWNGMSLLLVSKKNEKWLKNCENQRMLEKRR